MLNAGEIASQQSGKPIAATASASRSSRVPAYRRASRAPASRPPTIAAKKTLIADAARAGPSPTTDARKSAPQ